MNEKWRFPKPDLSASSKSYTNKRDTAHSHERPTLAEFQQAHYYEGDAAFIFLPREELIERSTFSITTAEVARFGLTVHLDTKEPHRVNSMTVAMYGTSRLGERQRTRWQLRTTMSETTVTSSPSAIQHFDILERKSRPTLRRGPTLTIESVLLQGLSWRSSTKRSL
jgi:hypothetical protein